MTPFRLPDPANRFIQSAKSTRLQRHKASLHPRGLCGAPLQDGHPGPSRSARRPVRRLREACPQRQSSITRLDRRLAIAFVRNGVGRDRPSSTILTVTAGWRNRAHLLVSPHGLHGHAVGARAAHRRALAGTLPMLTTRPPPHHGDRGALYVSELELGVHDQCAIIMLPGMEAR